MLRIAALVLIVNLWVPLALAQTKLGTNKSYQSGLGRMEGHLPELALPHFTEALKSFPKDAAAQATIHLKMGEASVRAARMEKTTSATELRAKAALEHLAHPNLNNDERAVFWSAQAHLQLADFASAAALFDRLSGAKDPDLRTRALLAQAHLIATMGKPEDAIALLAKLGAVKDPRIDGEARLLQATLLLMQGKHEELEALIPESAESPDPNFRAYASYLRARMHQAKDDHEKAEAEFRELTEMPQHLGTTIHHGAWVGLAESLQASGESEEAIETLISLIDKHPHTPLLEASFLRLLNWSTTESLKGRFAQQMALWANAPDITKPESTSKEPTGSSVVVSAATERTGFALYYYAIHLAEKNEAKSNQLAESLLKKLQDKIPDHPAVPASLLATASLQIGAQRKDDAMATLKELESSTGSLKIKAEAADLLARLKFQEGDFEAAAEAFQRVRKLLVPSQNENVAFNAGISLLRSDNEKAFGTFLGTLQPSETRNTLLLEQGLYLVSTGSGDARPALERFLRENRKHPRLPEARLAYAKEWLRLEPNSKSAHQQVKGELETLDQLNLPDPLALRHLLLHLQLAGLIKQWKPALAAANRFMKDRKPAEVAPIVRLRVAEAYFNNNDLPDAQREFQAVAAATEDAGVKEVAHYFAARAALELRSAKSPKEAVDLLQKVIAGKGPLANDARLLLARSLIDISPTDTLTVLQPLLAPETPNDRIDAFVLAAKAHSEIGTTANLREAIKIYDRLLGEATVSYPLSNRLHSLKGQVYERLGEPGMALETYYRVIDLENLREGEQPTEWYYFTECAYSAIQILETGRPRWQAALEILRKVEESGSPWSEQARKQREHMKLRHMAFDVD